MTKIRVPVPMFYPLSGMAKATTPVPRRRDHARDLNHGTQSLAQTPKRAVSFNASNPEAIVPRSDIQSLAGVFFLYSHQSGNSVGIVWPP